MLSNRPKSHFLFPLFSIFTITHSDLNCIFFQEKQKAKTMNSNYGKSSFDFDLGIGSSQSKSLNEQSLLYLFVFLYLTTQTRVAAQQALLNHQPAPTQPATCPGISSGPTSSTVGDIFGKTWSSSSAFGSGLDRLGPLWFKERLGCFALCWYG